MQKKKKKRKENLSGARCSLFYRDQSLSLENVTAVKKVQDTSRVEPLNISLERKKKKSFKEIAIDLELQMNFAAEGVIMEKQLKQ